MTEKQIKQNRNSILFGINKSIKNKQKKHYLSLNCPDFVKDKLKKNSIDYMTLQIDSEKLGKLIARNHNVCVICI